MRIALAALALAATPALARADSLLALDLVPPGASAGPEVGLGIPDLSFDGAPSALQLWAADGRGGSRRARAEPAVCLILGIIPGFGLGHYLAGSPYWTTWLVVDVIIALVFWGPFIFWADRPGYYPGLSLLVIVERVFEGIFAYEAAGGGPLFRLDRGLDLWSGPPAAVLAALPVVGRGSAR